MAPNSNERRVVRQWVDATCQTGEYKCLDDQGTTWRVPLGPLPPRATGETHGVLTGNTIKVTGG